MTNPHWKVFLWDRPPIRATLNMLVDPETNEVVLRAAIGLTPRAVTDEAA